MFYVQHARNHQYCRCRSFSDQKCKSSDTYWTGFYSVVVFMYWNFGKCVHAVSHMDGCGLHINTNELSICPWSPPWNCKLNVTSCEMGVSTQCSSCIFIFMMQCFSSSHLILLKASLHFLLSFFLYCNYHLFHLDLAGIVQSKYCYFLNLQCTIIHDSCLLFLLKEISQTMGGLEILWILNFMVGKTARE